jgi:glyoxylate reductase
MAKILVTRKIPGNALKVLTDSGHEVEISPYDRALTEEELVQRVKGKDAILSLLTDRVDGDVMDASGPQLKVIANYAVGFDNIDLPAAAERGIVVTNTPSDEVNEAVAEHTWALLLALSRRIVEADEASRRGGYIGWDPNIFLGTGLLGKTLGIVGLGRIGTMVAQRATGYNMTVLYNKRSQDLEAERTLGVKYTPLADLLAQSDFVTLHVPLNEETTHMMNKTTFAQMKAGAYLINTARGPVVDEHDLVEFLRSGHLGGAALDVYDNEPAINPELIGMENVVLTPHIASATKEARNKMGEQAVSAILALLKGTKPDNMVDEKVWDKRRK